MKRGKSKPRRGYDLMDASVKPLVERAICISGACRVSKPADVSRKTLRAWNEFWSLTARWEKHGASWVCVSGDGVLSRLKGMHPANAKTEVIRLGCEWAWE